MYKYEIIRLKGLQFAKTTANIGDIFRKTYPIDGANSYNQAALVVVIKGAFQFSVPTIRYSKVLTEGQTSLELDVTYPKDVICEETPIESNSIRYCIKAVDAGLKYTREVKNLNAGDTASLQTEDVLFVCSGAVTIGEKVFSKESILNLTGDKTLVAVEDSKIAIFRVG